MTSTLHDVFAERLASGGVLGADEIEQLASTPDILAVGSLADEMRRRRHGTRTTFVRVACCAFDKPLSEAVPPAAREVRLTGTPDSLEVALTAIGAARSVAGDRMLSGFSLADVQALAEGRGLSLKAALRRMREAGLEALAEVPLDRLSAPEAVLEALSGAGFEQVRLTIAKASPAERAALVTEAARLQQAYGCVRAFNPLPQSLSTFRPTTGYEDVKLVALARLAAPEIPTIQVDWLRYGPKLAQVALTFGADDLDNVSPADEASEGRRRAPLEEVRRNIQAAGFTAAERDGRFVVA